MTHANPPRAESIGRFGHQRKISAFGGVLRDVKRLMRADELPRTYPETIYEERAKAVDDTQRGVDIIEHIGMIPK
jgi:hypothetical protein